MRKSNYQSKFLIILFSLLFLSLNCGSKKDQEESPIVVDTDLDSISDDEDNCPDKANSDQADSDEDGFGDVCDNCPDDYNSLQEDSDEDGIGNTCDECPDDSTNTCNDCPDADGDSFLDESCGGNDCDDTDASIYIGAAEVCGDGIDQNCDGSDKICTWEKLLERENNEMPFFVDETRNNTFVIIGTETIKLDRGYSYNLYIVEVDINGNVIKEKSIEDKYSYAAIKTEDQGYLLSASSEIIKLDKDLNIEFEKSFIDGSVKSIHETSYGYLMFGSSSISGVFGGGDVYMLKVDKQGNFIGHNAFGGDETEHFWESEKMIDDGFIAIASSYNSAGGNQDENKDTYVLTFDNEGNIESEKLVGGDAYDYADKLYKTPEGNFAIVGFSYSAELPGYNEGEDAYIIKLDENGNELDQRLFGGNGVYDKCDDIIQKDDGGFVCVGMSSSTDIDGNKEGRDAYLLRVDKDLNLVSQELLGGDGSDYFHSIMQTQNRGFIALGSTTSSEKDGYKGENDIYFVRLDNSGNVINEKLFGNEGSDHINKFIQTQDGGILLVGYSCNDFYADCDIYMLKLTSVGAL